MANASFAEAVASRPFPWAKLWTKEYYYFDDEKTFPPINMRPNHTQRNRKCLHLKNLVCAFPPRCCSAGCFHSNRRFWGTGPCSSSSSSSRNVLLWSSGVAYMRSSNKRTTRACRTVLMGWGKSLRLWASLWGIWSLLDIFGFFFLFGALDSASTLEGLCVDEECQKGRWDRRHVRLLDDKCTIENRWFGVRCRSGEAFNEVGRNGVVSVVRDNQAFTEYIHHRHNLGGQNKPVCSSGKPSKFWSLTSRFLTPSPPYLAVVLERCEPSLHLQMPTARSMLQLDTIHLRTESRSLSPTPKRLVLPKGRLDMAVSVKSNEGGPLPLLLRLYEYYFSERVSWENNELNEICAHKSQIIAIQFPHPFPVFHPSLHMSELAYRTPHNFLIEPRHPHK